MQRNYRLRKNKQFAYVYRRGKSVACKELVLLHAKGQGLKVGFSVSKKVGNAVTRNLIKRRLKECFRKRMDSVKPGLYVIVARPVAAQATFSALDSGLYYLLKKQSLISEGSGMQ